jgi:hypothetical protein
MGMSEVPRCQHIKVNGVQCGSPALRRKRFCYFHDNYRATQARLMEDRSEVRIVNFPLLEDANSVQVAVMHVIHLLGSGKMDTKVAGLILYALQTASANMKRINFESGQPTDVVIDQDTLELTCINGPQWFERDFEEHPVVKTEAEVTRREELPPAGRAQVRKKPEKPAQTSDKDLVKEMLRQIGLTPRNEEASAESDAYAAWPALAATGGSCVRVHV